MQKKKIVKFPDEKPMSGKIATIFFHFKDFLQNNVLFKKVFQVYECVI